MGEVKAAEAGSSSARAGNYMSVAYRSATVEGRKRMNARDNPKEGERERVERGRNSKAKDRSDLYRALLLDLDLVPLDSRGPCNPLAARGIWIRNFFGILWNSPLDRCPLFRPGNCDSYLFERRPPGPGFIT